MIWNAGRLSDIGGVGSIRFGDSSCRLFGSWVSHTHEFSWHRIKAPPPRLRSAINSPPNFIACSEIPPPRRSRSWFVGSAMSTRRSAPAARPEEAERQTSERFLRLAHRDIQKSTSLPQFRDATMPGVLEQPPSLTLPPASCLQPQPQPQAEPHVESKARHGRPAWPKRLIGRGCPWPGTA